MDGETERRSRAPRAATLCTIHSLRFTIARHFTIAVTMRAQAVTMRTQAVTIHTRCAAREANPNPNPNPNSNPNPGAPP
eukprot:scaffold10795_cov30-Phaeocystis_antarctica.AAC.1